VDKCCRRASDGLLGMTSAPFHGTQSQPLAQATAYHHSCKQATPVMLWQRRQERSHKKQMPPHAHPRTHAHAHTHIHR
jgi:hypothetical protein